MDQRGMGEHSIMVTENLLRDSGLPGHDVPAEVDPARDEFRQGNTLGPAYRHWRRAKIGRWFRLFFRYDSKAKVIVYAWGNDEQTLRSAGSKSDPYAVFEKMLGRGNPPDDWNALMAASQQDWSRLE